MSTPKRALVLGCGAVAGAAWSIAILDCLQRQLDWDAREADILIGTSAGSVLAALLASGVSVERMMASQLGETSDCDWNHDRDSGGAIPPWPGLRFPAKKLVWHGLRGEVSPLTALTGLLPEGRTDMSGFRRLIDNVVPKGEWVSHPAAWMMVVDANTGERIALGRRSSPKAALNQAVCASYAVPAVCPPITIAGRTFIDGGVASPTSADFLIGTDIEEAIVLAPFASTHVDKPKSPFMRVERRIRRTMTHIVDQEVAALKQAGIRVVRLEPGPEDLRAIGFNMMDPSRREQVFKTAQKTASTTVQTALAVAGS